MQKVAKFIGVYYYESSTKMWKGLPDRCFYVTYKLHGRLTREKVGWQSEGYSAKLASHVRAERIRTIRHGDTLPSQRKTTFGDIWKAYDEWLTNGKAWPEDDRLRYHKYLEERFKNTPLEQISPFDLERLKSDLIANNLSPATIKHVLVLFRQIWNKAVKWNMTRIQNPISAIQLPRVQNRRERFLTREQAKMLLAELMIIDQPIYEMALLSLQTGMRAGEIFALRWADVDVDTLTISVPTGRGGMKRAGRKVYMNETVAKMFTEKPLGGPVEWIFATSNGKQRTKMSKIFLKTVRRIGLNDGVTDRRDLVTFHTLRHSFASWLAQQGTPLVAIKELMGHSTLSMTERYSHLIPDLKRDAIRRIELGSLSSIPAGESSSHPNQSEHNGQNDRL